MAKNFKLRPACTPVRGMPLLLGAPQLLIALAVYLLMQPARVAAGPPAPAPLECGMRKLALARAMEMQPWRDHRATFDALELATLCGVPPPTPVPQVHSPFNTTALPVPTPLPAGVPVLHVDPTVRPHRPAQP